MFKKYSYFSAIIICLINSSCSSLNKEPLETKLVDLKFFQSRNFNDPNLEEFIKKINGKKPEKNWGADNLYLAAIYFNPRMEVVKRELQLAKASEVTAGQIPNPIISLVPGRDNTSSIRSQNFMPMSFTLPIETNGKRGLRKAITQFRTAAAQAKIETIKWDIRREILASLINLYSADQKRKIYQDATTTQKNIINIYEQRAKQGQLLTAIASQANIVDLQTQLQLQDSKAIKDKSLVSLASSISVPLDSVNQISIDFSDIKKIAQSDLDLENLRAKTLLNNPELVAALMEYNATHEALKLEIAKQIPDVNIGPAYQWDAHDGGKIGLGFSLTLPIFNQNEGPIAEAKARREIAAANFNVIQARIISGIETAEVSLVTAKKQYDLAKKLLDEERHKIKTLQSQLSKSELGKLPMLHALSEAQVVHQNVIDAEVQVLRAFAELENATRVTLF